VRNKSFTVPEKNSKSSECLVLARFYFNIKRLDPRFFTQVFNDFTWFSLHRKLIFNSLLNVILTRTQNIAFLYVNSKYIDVDKGYFSQFDEEITQFGTISD
jgi:hypothetical protein